MKSLENKRGESQARGFKDPRKHGDCQGTRGIRMWVFLEEKFQSCDATDSQNFGNAAGLASLRVLATHCELHQRAD